MTIFVSILGSIGTFLFFVWLSGGESYLSRRAEMKHKERLAMIEATKSHNQKTIVED